MYTKDQTEMSQEELNALMAKLQAQQQPNSNPFAPGAGIKFDPENTLNNQFAPQSDEDKQLADIIQKQQSRQAQSANIPFAQPEVGPSINDIPGDSGKVSVSDINPKQLPLNKFSPNKVEPLADEDLSPPTLQSKNNLSQKPYEDKINENQSVAEEPAISQNSTEVVRNPVTGQLEASQDTINELSDLSRAQIGRNQTNADLLMLLTKNLASKPQQVNMNPFFGFANSLDPRGTNYAQGYVAPQSPEEQRAELLKTFGAGNQLNQQATTDQESLLKTLLQGQNNQLGILNKFNIADLNNQTKLRGQDLTDKFHSAMSGVAQQNADTSAGRLSETQRHNQAIEALKNQGTNVQAGRLSLQQSKALQAAENAKPVVQWQQKEQLIDGLLQFDSKEKPTVQSLHEAMVGLRTALTNGGRTGEAERAGMYLNSLEWKYKAALQSGLGHMVYIDRNDDIYKYLVHTLHTEKDIAHTQYEKALKANFQNYSSIMNSNPGMASDASNTLKARGMSSDIGTAPMPKSKEEAQAILNKLGIK